MANLSFETDPPRLCCLNAYGCATCKAARFNFFYYLFIFFASLTQRAGCEETAPYLFPRIQTILFLLYRSNKHIPASTYRWKSILTNSFQQIGGNDGRTTECIDLREDSGRKVLSPGTPSTPCVIPYMHVYDPVSYDISPAKKMVCLPCAAPQAPCLRLSTLLAGRIL